MATSSDTKAPYVVRTLRDGEVGFVNHGTEHLDDAEAVYAEWESFYLNLPDPALASGVTLQLITRDDTVACEVTFP